MVDRTTIDFWEAVLDEMAETYAHVLATVGDLPEIKTDLTGTTSKGRPPGLPGGDKLVAVGPFSMDAPRDDYAHPLHFAYAWSWHCAEANAAIPPRRAWEPSLAYLRAHLHLIDGEYVAEFHGDLQRTRGSLRRLCNWDRRARQEEEDESELRGAQAQAVLRGLVDAGEFPEWIEPSRLQRYREPVTLNREEAEIIFPELRRPGEDDYSEFDPADIDDAWHRIAARKQAWAKKGDKFPVGRYLVLWVQDEARKLKRW